MITRDEINLPPGFFAHRLTKCRQREKTKALLAIDFETQVNIAINMCLAPGIRTKKNHGFDGGNRAGCLADGGLNLGSIQNARRGAFARRAFTK